MHERRMQLLNQRKRRKRKKRKKRLPRTRRPRRWRARGLLVVMHLALCSLLLCLRCSASWPVCTRRTVPRSSSILAEWQRHVQGWFCWLLWTSFMFPSVVVRSKMLGILACMDQMDSHVVCLVNIPVVAQRLVPWSRLFCGPWKLPSCSWRCSSLIVAVARARLILLVLHALGMCSLSLFAGPLHLLQKKQFFESSRKRCNP